MPEAKKLLENLPFAAEFWVRIIEYRIPRAVEVPPKIGNSDLQRLEVFGLFV